MARKIYMKFSDERNLENSIRTVIREEDRRRTVVKQAIFEEGMAHIRDMYEKAALLRKSFPNIKVSNAVIEGDILQCDYVEGVSLTEIYMSRICDKNKEKLLELIEKHIDLVKGDEENQCIFRESDDSKRLFGDLSRFNGEKALKITNFEATANNIYLSEHDIYFIDYEWIFDFPIPLDLVVYHCIVWTGYANMPQLEKIMSKRELMRYLQIDNDLCENHINYINYITENNAYYLAKMNYAKGKYCLHDVDQIWLAKMGKQQRYIDNLEAGLKSQQKYIDDLEAAKENQQEYIAGLEADKENQQEYIAGLETAKEDQQEYINDLEKNKEKQQEYISKLEKEMIDLEEDVEKEKEHRRNLDQISNDQQERLSYLEGALAVQNKYVVNLENKIERYIEKQGNS